MRSVHSLCSYYVYRNVAYQSIPWGEIESAEQKQERKDTKKLMPYLSLRAQKRLKL